MHDIKAIRENPQAFDRAWALKGLAPQTREILELDAALRGVQTILQDSQSRRNEASKLIGQAKAQKDEDLARRLMGEVENLKASITENTNAEAQIGQRLREILASLPNLPAEDVPPGEDESGNVEQRRWGEPKDLPTAPLGCRAPGSSC
jgi:seryl-tRNA synthetase